MIWDYRVQCFADECEKSQLPKPCRLVMTVCIKSIVGPDQMHLIALKSVSGRRFCAFFVGEGKPGCGDLAVLCGRGVDLKLLINSNNSNHIAWYCTGNSDHLYLPHRWVQVAFAPGV